MYICPICKRAFKEEEKIAKHSLGCWREHNPCHQSTPAPRSENITERKVNNEVMSFFEGLKCKK